MRVHYLILLLVVSIFTVSFTENCTAKQPEIQNIKESAFKSYKDIPNITESEVVAIEKLKQSRSMFIYGVNITTEAFITNDDAVDGFARLLCDRLSALFGVQFIPQAYGWDTLNEKLDAKVIDFTGELSPNPERQKKYFMTTPLFQRTIKIFSNKHNEPLKIIAQDRAIKCGFLTGSTTYKLVKDSIALPFEPFFVEDEREAPALLKNKVIDAFIDESSAEALFEKSSFAKVDDFFPLYYSPLSLTSANPELEPIISVIQKYLKNGGFEEIRALYNLGANMYTKHRLFNLFSEEEKAYIDAHNSNATTIAFGAEYDNYPISFYNSKEKVFQGIAVDVLQKVSSLTGLEFKVANKPETTWPALLQQLEDGKIAIISELVPSKLRQGKFLWTDKPNSVDRYALLSRSDYPNIDINQIVYAKVGLIAESAAAELFHEWFPDSLKVTSYVGYLEAFEALEKGEIDLLMATETLLLSLTNYLEKPGFKANIVFQQSSEAFFGLNKEDALLQSIVNKALLLIDSEYISDSWKRRVFDYKSKMLKDTFPYISALIFLLLLGLITVALLLMKNRRMSHNLEFIVIQRTKELEKVSRAKSDFLSSMSHEMRTPMNAIIGMTKIADRTEEVPKLRYCLSVIQASSTHLLGLINDILDMSKIEAGKFELHSAPFNLDNTLRKICNLIIDKTTQKKQKLSVVLNKEMHLSYVGDELKLSQVITNLLSNAVKFTPEGGTISLIVTEVERKEERSILRFSITDTGIGMTQEQIARLFQPFEQADGSITKRFGGTGLGLAISKNIIEQMNGRVWVESELGSGSAFIFDVELEPLLHDEVNNSFESTEPSKIKLLVVESDNAALDDFCTIVHQFGMDCNHSSRGQDALELINTAYKENIPYDLLFISSQLLKIEGSEMLSQLKGKIDENAVIVVAENAERESIQTLAHSYGIYKSIAKPVLASEILNVISEIMGTSINKHNIEPAVVKALPDFSRLHLLLVEDVEINQEIFISLLEDTGLQIDVANNGLEAVEKFSQNTELYAMIIMDLQMPQMDGYEATKLIRLMEHPRAKTIPIVAMTANAFKEDIDKCLAIGMNDHISKPIDEKIVMEKILLFTQAGQNVLL